MEAQPQRAMAQGSEETEQTRAFLRLCQQKTSTTGEPEAEGGPRNKESQSLARFPFLSQTLDTELIS